MILAGQLLVDTYGTMDVNTEYNGELIDFNYSSSYNTHYSAISLDNGDIPPVERYIACYDAEHIWFVSNDYILNTLAHMTSAMSKYGLTLETMTTDRIMDVIRENLAGNASSIAIVFMGGSLPIDLYNGSEDCLLIHWLESGGRIVWGNGPIGGYISYESECIEQDNAGKILFDSEDAVNNQSGELFDNNGIYTGKISDVFRMYFSECTYGIKGGINADQLVMDYQVDGYYATTITKYHGGSGIMYVFGGHVNHLNVDYIVQVLASGLTYKSEIIDFQYGMSSTISGKLKACLERPTLFITFGLMNDYSGRLYTFEPQL